MKLSVVVATYNRPALLRELLDSLAKQTLPRDRWEVIVVDDGSKEPVTLPGYDVTLIRQDNAGVAAARNTGIMRATGDVIVVTDDDMLVPPDFLAAHMKMHEAGYTLVLGHIAEPKIEGKKPLFERMHVRQLNKFIDHYRDKPTEVRGIMVCTGNVSFRRDLYMRLGGFDRSLQRSEDRELGVRMEKNGAKLTFAYDAKTFNRSDHTDFNVWMRRNFQYGVYDSRISKKHPDVEIADPWRYLFLVNPVSAVLLAGTVAAPTLMQPVARMVYGLAEGLDALGLETPAIAGATLCYGIEYFRGVREEAGSLRGSARDLARYIRRRKA